MLYLMGFLLALVSGFEWDLLKFILGYLIFGTAHLSVSFSNDFFDRKADRNSVKTAFSGGSRILIEHPELESFAFRMALLLLCSSIFFNAVFTALYALPFWFFVFGLLGALLGWFYTAPPLKLAYRGLGELATMLVVGFFMPGMGYLAAAGTIGPLLQVFILPLCCYGFFFIITVHLPDLESDTLSHKKNVLTRWGMNTGKWVSLGATLAGTVFLFLLFHFEVTRGVLDVLPFAVISIFPLVASVSCVLVNINDRRVRVRQVMFNMAAMVLMLFLIDISLILQFL